MLVLNARRASPSLRAVARGYKEFWSRTQGEAVVVLPARPELFVEFYLCEPYRIRDEGEAPRPVEADAMVVAPIVRRRVALHSSGEVHVFHVTFEPTALHRMLGVHMPDLVDRGVRAADVFGWRLDALRDGVMRAADFDARVRATEDWLEQRMGEARPTDAFDHAARRVRWTAGARPLEAYVAEAALGKRQWRRRFKEQTGVSPKLYVRITRLEGALAARRARPELAWAEIASRFGYYDQSHMLRDARDLLQATPFEWLSDPNAWPFAPPA